MARYGCLKFFNTNIGFILMYVLLLLFESGDIFGHFPVVSEVCMTSSSALSFGYFCGIVSLSGYFDRSVFPQRKSADQTLLFSIGTNSFLEQKYLGTCN